MFENKEINGIYATRFIASWLKKGGQLRYGRDIDDFREWLESLKLNDEDIKDIIFLATNGKLELETSAGKFLFKKKIIVRDLES